MFDNNYLLFLHLFRYKHHRTLRRTGMSGYYSATHVQDKAMLKQDEAMLEQDKGKLKQDEAMHVRRTCKTMQRMCMYCINST